MVVPLEPDRLSLPDLRYRLDAVTCLRDAESVARQYLLVTLRMQLREPLRELKLLAVDAQRAERAFLALHGICRQADRVDTQEVTHARFLQLQVSCHAIKTHHMHDVLLYRTEYPLQHVVKMHADVRGYTAGLVHIAFPRRVVPLAAACNVRQIHVIDLVFRTLIHLLFQGTDLVVQTQLQDRVGVMSRFLLQLHQVVDVVRIEHQRLFAYHIAAQTQSVTDKRIVGVVRRADTYPVQRVVRTHLFGAETVELLVLGKERTVRKR